MMTTDVDAVYDKIRGGTITAGTVKYLSSKYFQSMALLDDFPNIEEISCVIVCPFEELNTLGTRISSRHHLKTISFIVYIPSEKIIPKAVTTKSSEPPAKKLRLVELTPYQRALKITIPGIIKKLGIRMRYITLNIMAVDMVTDIYTMIILNKGFFNVYSGDKIVKYTENIFDAMSSSGSLQGIMTYDSPQYNLSKVNGFTEVTILTRRNTKNNPINRKYLRALVSRVEIVTIMYDSHTIDDMYLYSDILLYGSSGSLKQIKGIVPAMDIEEHIRINKNLEAIYVLLSNYDDFEDIRYTMTRYQDRAISYYIHYDPDLDFPQYELKNLGDVIFYDVTQIISDISPIPIELL